MHMRLYKEYISLLLNSKDIYIEVGDWTKRDFQMTIDARKIISNLDAIGKCGVRSITKYEMGSIN